MENVEAASQLWQVETGGKVFDATFDEMTEWVADGALLRIDRVRKGNLRWIEAGKVPQLIEFFNAKDASQPIAPVITTTNIERLGVPDQAVIIVAPGTEIGASISHDHPTAVAGADACSMHPDVPAVFVCDTCCSLFCKA